jgi:hypothetical protein
MSTKDVLARVQSAYPQIRFAEGTDFMWSIKDQTVTYSTNVSDTDKFTSSLCHELSHGILGHADFKHDIELIKLERDAWDHATTIARDLFDLTIPTDHIEDCMNTYRDWLYQRSLCPTCKQCGLQQTKQQYSCIMCNSRWRVNVSRLCRVHKRRVAQ